MKDTLITFETSQQLKGLNFPSTEYGFLVNTKQIVRTKNHMLEGKAPSQSLLQKWLREKYKIEIYVRPSFKKINTYIVSYMKLHSSKEFYQQYFIIPKDDKGQYSGTHVDFNTYEEALEKGLEEALKLIKK